MPGRIVNLLENDLLQALPLYVLMGVLLDRLAVDDGAVSHVLLAAAAADRAAPLVAGLGLGALLGPMSGSVGASVLGLSRAVEPRLGGRRRAAPTRQALVAVASTLGVVVPPSLVLILLGDAMLDRAHHRQQRHAPHGSHHQHAGRVARRAAAGRRSARCAWWSPGWSDAACAARDGQCAPTSGRRLPNWRCPR